MFYEFSIKIFLQFTKKKITAEAGPVFLKGNLVKVKICKWVNAWPYSSRSYDSLKEILLFIPPSLYSLQFLNKKWDIKLCLASQTFGWKRTIHKYGASWNAKTMCQIMALFHRKPHITKTAYTRDPVMLSQINADYVSGVGQYESTDRNRDLLIKTKQQPPRLEEGGVRHDQTLLLRTTSGHRLHRAPLIFEPRLS